MISIITYISVLERTKEIGILKALGASKKDITRVFNAETIIEGFVAGVFGILVTILVNIPINKIVYNMFNVDNIASLPFIGGIILIGISVLLTVIAGLIPSRMASRKDPVESLRSE
jgi:putative ABC transport system permease protein